MSHGSFIHASVWTRRSRTPGITAKQASYSFDCFLHGLYLNIVVGVVVVRRTSLGPWQRVLMVSTTAAF